MKLEKIGEVPPLSLAEEVALTTEYARTRAPRLAERIAAANLRLVIKMAAGYARRSAVSLEDLVQDGTVGLMHAVERYDPRRGVRFATYATWWIRAFLLRSLLDNTRTVRAGRSREDRRAFFQGGAPPPEVSLDAPVIGDGAPFREVLPDAGPGPDELIEEAEARDVVLGQAQAFRKTLPAREAAVFSERFLRDEATPLSQLAHRFSVTRERVRQIERELVSDFCAFGRAA